MRPSDGEGEGERDSEREEREVGRRVLRASRQRRVTLYSDYALNRPPNFERGACRGHLRAYEGTGGGGRLRCRSR